MYYVYVRLGRRRPDRGGLLHRRAGGAVPEHIMYVCVYVCMYVCMYMYMYMYMYMHMHMHMYIYIYIHRERERDTLIYTYNDIILGAVPQREQRRRPHGRAGGIRY